jgi:hypothetical protein
MMRTTLEIDDDVLAAARELAARQHKTAGKLISELARKGIHAHQGDHPQSAETGSKSYRQPTGLLRLRWCGNFWKSQTNRDRTA